MVSSFKEILKKAAETVESIEKNKMEVDNLLELKKISCKNETDTGKNEIKKEKGHWIDVNNTHKKLISLKEKMKNIKIRGNILSVSGIKELKDIKYINVFFYDDTSKINIKIWNKKIFEFLDFYRNLENPRNKEVEFSNIYIKSYNTRLEARLSIRGKFKITNKERIYDYPTLRINDYYSESKIFNLAVVIYDMFNYEREIVLYLADSTGTIRCSIQRDKFSRINFELGKFLELSNFTVKRNEKTLELISNEDSSIKTIDEIPLNTKEIKIVRDSYRLVIVDYSNGYFEARELFNFANLFPGNRYFFPDSKNILERIVIGDAINITGLVIKKQNTQKIQETDHFGMLNDELNEKNKIFIIKFLKIEKLFKLEQIKKQLNIKYPLRDWIFNDELSELQNDKFNIKIQNNIIPLFIQKELELIKTKINVTFNISLECRVKFKLFNKNIKQEFHFDSKIDNIETIKFLNLDEISNKILKTYTENEIEKNKAIKLTNFQKILMHNYAEKYDKFVSIDEIKGIAKEKGIEELESLTIKNWFFNDEEYRNEYFSYLETSVLSDTQQGKVFISSEYIFFIFPKNNLLILESPKKGKATYLFDIPQNIANFFKDIQKLRRMEILNSHKLRKKLGFRKRIIHDFRWKKKIRNELLAFKKNK
ncbi:MAG: hypothetical protein EAX96_06540 [Candidatus Lokiarchaeota archaeon]|nr:hypothetical protein [Candidatus Lokiarchaeota archaeon]